MAFGGCYGHMSITKHCRTPHSPPSQLELYATPMPKPRFQPTHRRFSILTTNREFDAKYKLDIKGNLRASFRLRGACEKAKKILTTNPEAVVSVECIADDKDVAGSITREVFEEEAKATLDKLVQTVRKVCVVVCSCGGGGEAGTLWLPWRGEDGAWLH